MQAFLVSSEGTVSCFFLLLTLFLAYHKAETRRRDTLRLLLFLTAFTLIDKPIESISSNLYFFVGLLFACGIGYAACFNNQPFLGRVCIIVTYIYSIVASNAICTFALSSTANYRIENGIPSATSLELILHYSLLYAMLLVLAIFYSHFSIRTEMRLPTQYWIILLCASLASAMVVQQLSDEHFRSGVATPAPLLCISLSLILLVYYLCYLIVNFYQEALSAQAISQRLSLELKYVSGSEALVEQVHKEKHELKNIYFYLQALLKEKDYKQLENYINTELGYRLNSNEVFHTGNHLVDLCLTQEVSKARQNDISVITDILLPDKLFLSDEEICSLLMNLLDNAIEASLSEKARDIRVNIRVVRGYLQIQIKNRCQRNVLESNSLLSTTKSDSIHHGLGLKIVRTIAERHNGITDISYQDGYFCITVLLDQGTANAKASSPM